ncbi:MAG: HAMP domain-containing protein [Spirochaetes bacterium]|nr:HAMP domain-containing protein [Spirochaetota bacterium]
MRIKDIKIRTKFTLVFSIITLVILLVSVLQIINLSQIAASAESIYKVRLLSINYLLQADRDAYQSSIAISQALNIAAGTKGSSPDIDKLTAAINENYEQIGQRFGKFMDLHLAHGGEQVEEFAQFTENYGPMNTQTQQIIKLIKNGRTAEAASIYNTSYNASFSKARDAMDRLTQITETTAENEFNSILSSNNRGKAISVIAMIITTIILSAVSITATRSFTIPIFKMVKFAEKIRDRDVSARVSDDRKDELGILINSLNQAIESVDVTLHGILEVSDQVFNAVSQITTGNLDLSQRTSEQASSLEEIAATIEQSTAAVSRTAEVSREAKNLSESGTSISEEGSLIAHTATDSINEINVSSKRIVDIITVINEIAFQTNLLALNAAVEAARAGDQGRGFAVVAGEVRNLAQRSGNASKEIESLIKDSVIKVEKGTSLVLKTGEALQNISLSNRETANLISEIATAGEEQMSGMEQINKAVMDLDKMTQQNAALVEEVSTLSEEVLTRAKEMKEAVNLFTITD